MRDISVIRIAGQLCSGMLCEFFFCWELFPNLAHVQVALFVRPESGALGDDATASALSQTLGDPNLFDEFVDNVLARIGATALVLVQQIPPDLSPKRAFRELFPV